MAAADEWFHEQLVRLRPPPIRASVPAPAPSIRGRATILGSTALLALVGLFAMEAMGGPIRADQPFGLSAPPAMVRASTLPSVNGRGPAAPVSDRNKVAMSGIEPWH